MKTFIKIIGPCSGLNTPSLYISSGPYRILVNAGEGVQRLLLEYGCSMNKLTHILTTSNNPSSTAGLTGVLMGSGDHIDEAFLEERKSDFEGNVTNIIGPSGLARNLFSSRAFFKKSLSVLNVSELTPSYKSNILRFKSANTHVSSTIEPMTFSNALYSTKTMSFDYNKFSSIKNFSVVNYEQLTEEKETKEYKENFTSYVINIGKARGKFNPKLAMKFGLTDGRDYGKLTSGISVVNSEGRTITPDECLDAPEKSNLCVVIDCNEASIDNLLDKISTNNLLSDQTNKELKVVYHIANKDTVSSKKYQTEVVDELSKKWGSEVKHIFVGKGYKFRNDVHQTSDICLKAFKKEAFSYFPAIDTVLDNSEENSKICPIDFAENNTNKLFGSTLLTQYFFQKGKDNSGLSIDAYKEQLSNLRNLKQREFNLNKNKEKPTPCKFSFPENFQISLLGTCSTGPTLYRNVSGTALVVGKTGFGALLDCGEGSLYQLYKALGEEKAEHFLTKQLNLLFISHHHADHCSGVRGLLSRRNELLAKHNITPSNKLQIYGPSALLSHFKDLDLLDLELKDSYAYNVLSSGTSMSINANGITMQLQPVYVQHKVEAYGAVIRFTVSTNGSKNLEQDLKRQKTKQNKELSIVYSGDTSYCRELVRAGENCDILIHEATFSEFERPKADKKGHSTVVDAIAAGYEMNVKRNILFHFSRKYVSLPITPIESKALSAYSGFNFVHGLDLMTLTKQNLPQAPIVSENLLGVRFHTDAYSLQ